MLILQININENSIKTPQISPDISSVECTAFIFEVNIKLKWFHFTFLKHDPDLVRLHHTFQTAFSNCMASFSHPYFTIESITNSTSTALQLFLLTLLSLRKPSH